MTAVPENAAAAARAAVIPAAKAPAYENRRPDIAQRKTAPEQNGGRDSGERTAKVTAELALRQLRSGMEQSEIPAERASALASLTGNSAMLELLDLGPETSLLAPFTLGGESGADGRAPFPIQAPAPLLTAGDGLVTAGSRL
jgi:hypothetical protein